MASTIKRTTKRIGSAFIEVTTRRLNGSDRYARYVMYQRLHEVARSLPQRYGRALAVSHSANLVDVLGVEVDELVDVHFPDVTLMDLPYPDDSFDLVLTDQVLTCVEGNPFQAFAESVRVLKPGGFVVHTTCLATPLVGDGTYDFWRFTPRGLEVLAGDLEIIDIGGWGNRFIVLLDQLHLRYVRIPHARWHPMHQVATANHPRFPVSTWLVARKPLAPVDDEVLVAADAGVGYSG